MDPRQAIKDFWDEAACGERLYLEGESGRDYARQAETRFALEPFIPEFARWDRYRGKRVLEIGVGLGADHQRFAEAGAWLTGVDLTHRAVAHTKKRFDLLGLRSRLLVADAEHLPFPDGFFDLVYSWGVVHHAAEPPRVLKEIHRTLRLGGECKLMLYHKRSMVGAMLWTRYALLRGRPGTPLAEIYGRYLESPGTKAYSRDEARRMLHEAGLERVETAIHLSHGDLLSSGAGQRHRGPLLYMARRLWPRWALRSFFSSWGLFMTVRAEKPAGG